MNPIEAILYGVGVFITGTLTAVLLMLIFADLFEFNEQLDNLWDKVKRWFNRD